MPGEAGPGGWSNSDRQHVLSQLARLAEHPLFANAGKLTALLRYLVDVELSGRGSKLGQIDIAVDVMHRGAEFNPAVDSVVRVEIGRLRARLREYYATEGRADLIRITLPKGRYTPVIEIEAQASAAESSPQEIRFIRTPDGVSLAYAVSGAGPPLVKVANWLSHLEYDFQSPVWRHWWQALSQSYTLVRYDERGCGLSDWDVDNFSLEAWVNDLEAVTAAIDYRRFALLGISQGAAVAVRYAVRHPERVSHLVLYGGFAQGRLRRHPSQAQIDEARMLAELARIGWGQEHPVFRKVFASLFIPDASAAEIASFDALQRYSTSPENAARFIEAFNGIDVTQDLSRVETPTLVLHARNEIEIPVSQAQLLAKTIPGAKLVLLDSERHILCESEAAWGRFLGELDAFLRS